ncbi:MAG: hypothetical protein GY765_41505 [bacterium]|nr:hypothetical protein [bacterium]
MKERKLFCLTVYLFLVLFQLPVFSAVFTVTTTEDKVAGSLRAAIDAAEANGEVNVIYLPAGVYTLAPYAYDEPVWGSFDIELPYTDYSSLYIIGEGSASTIINCGRKDRAFKIVSGNVHIMDISIKNGRAPDTHLEAGDHHGGGIWNEADLYLTRCTISDCSTGSRDLSTSQGTVGGSGGAILNIDGARLTMEECIINNNHTEESREGRILWSGGGAGGGIYNNATMSIINCTISNNYTGDGFPGGYGGGIAHSGGSLHIYNSTISGNHTGNGPVGLWLGIAGNGGDGGGICIGSGEATMVNCTVGENYTGNGYNDGESHSSGAGRGGGISVLYGSLSVYASTICSNYTGDGPDYNTQGNGGGIFVDSTGELLLSNSIVGDNRVGDSGAGPDGWGVFDSDGYNLIENTDEITWQGDLTGNIDGVDPQLSPLADNGGFTETCALQSGSPAINAGGGTHGHDQRYFPGPVDIAENPNAGTGWDIGAYEYNAPAKAYLSLNRNLIKISADKAGNKTGSQTFTITTDLTWKLSVQGANPFVAADELSGTGTTDLTVDLSPTRLANLAPGIYISEYRVSSDEAYNWTSFNTKNMFVILTLYDSQAVSAPFGSFDSPVSGTTVSSSIPVTGWALDDIGVESVKIYRDPVTGEGSDRVFLGDAIQVEYARPDVASAYLSYPGNTMAGWGYMMLTNFLPNYGNGTFYLYAVVTDVEGNETVMGPKVITCDNGNAVNPFGAIDTPGQGETVSGDEYNNFGWALTPPPNTIPFDASTIYVFIDGAPVGNPVYNVYREDIDTLFPGYKNSDGALGYFTFDTTAYENGVHTISWGVSDDAGNSDGIGSRYFTIQNENGAARETAPVARSESPADYESDSFKLHAVTENGEREITADEKGIFHVKIRETERLVLGTAGYTDGHLEVKGSLKKLPVGSTLDAAGGLFYWQPGPGFLGTYTLVFTGKDRLRLKSGKPGTPPVEKRKREKRVTVTIVPKE